MYIDEELVCIIVYEWDGEEMREEKFLARIAKFTIHRIHVRLMVDALQRARVDENCRVRNMNAPTQKSI